MGVLRRPDVPPGPTRELVDALHELHHHAGWPSLRDLGRQIGVSRTTVAAAFSGPRPPRWGVLELLVEALGGDVDQFHGWWLAATGADSAAGSSPVPGSNPASAGEPAASPTYPIPRQLPADVSDFTGRTEQLRMLDEVAGRDRTSAIDVAVISGTAGVGKTALAVHWAHRWAHRFPDGQLFVNLRGYDPEQPLRPADVLEQLLRALGVHGQHIPAELAERAAVYRSVLSGRQVLIVLDNVRSAAQVRDLLPGTSGCLVVVTSRDSLSPLVVRQGAVRLLVDLLSASDAILLLRTLIGSRVVDEPKAAEALADRCARLPLALRLAAELAVSRPHDRLVDLLADLDRGSDRLDLLDAGQDEYTAIRAVFSWSYGSLPDDARAGFLAAAWHPGADFDAPALAALAGIDLAAARRLLTTLERAHLAESVAAGRFVMHDLLKAYAVELADGDPTADRPAALGRLFDHYTAAATRAVDASIPPSRRGLTTTTPVELDASAAAAWLDAERRNLLAAALAAIPDRPEVTAALSATLASFLDARGYYADAVTLHEAAEQAAAAHGDPAGRAAALNRLGLVRRRLGRYRDAGDLHQRALFIHRRLGDRPGEAGALTDLGIIGWRSGHYEEARDRLTEALALRRDLGDRAGEGAALYNLGIVYRRLGDYRLAADCHQRALSIQREIGDRVGESRTLSNAGVLLLRLGQLDEAIDHHRQALIIQRHHGDRAGESAALTNVGLTLERMGRQTEAFDHFLLAVEISRDIGYRVGEADALRGLGVVSGRLAHYPEAIRYLEAAVEIGQQIGESDVETGALNELGEVLFDAGRPAEAGELHEAALAKATRSGDRYEQGRALSGLADIAAGAGRWDPARRQWRLALRHFTDLGLPEAAETAAKLQRAAADAATGDPRRTVV